MRQAALDLTGEIIDGRFRVEQKLGAGGMSTVWQVQHTESLQRFALKVLSSSMTENAAVRERFLREARATATLRSRHVVRNIDVQMGYLHRGEKTPYLVMELLEGLDLATLLRHRRKLSAGETLWIAEQVAAGLEAAHRAGIVHRDLKPENLFVTTDDDGRPLLKLCDFGIAKLTGEARSLAGTDQASTQSGSVLRTPLYMAPEQLRDGGKVTAATDQWALGMVAFKALAGFDYFLGAQSSSELVLRIAQDTLVAPSDKAAELPAGFDAWFRRACARRPQDRFPSVGEQVNRLAASLGDPAPSALVADDLGDPSERVGLAATVPFAPHRKLGARRIVGLALVSLVTLAMLLGVHFTATSWMEGSARSGVRWLLPGDGAASAARPTIEVVAAPTATGHKPPTGPASAVVPTPPATQSAIVDSTAAPSVRHQPAVAPPRRRAPASAPPKARPTQPTTQPPTKPALRPTGAACSRSKQCRSGLCVAEVCR